MSYAWQERSAQPSHADDWLITYADMITLLLCFFVLFLVVTVAKNKTLHPEEAQPKIEQVETIKSEDIQLPEAFQKNIQDEETVETLPIQPPQPVLEPKGDRITIMEVNSAAFFDSGSAVINDSGKLLLQGVAENLKSEEFNGYQITVEGHTDDTPIATAQFPSNWELSTARASAVVRTLVEQGLPAQKLRAAGYADTFPKAPNRDADGNPLFANQAENRRVIIKLEKIERAQ